MSEHLFHSELTWTGAGSAPFEYDHYSRDLRVRLPGRPDLEMSSAPGFLGDAGRTNPEDLILAAASACHALTFLAVAARSRMKVLSYEDRATAVLAPEDGKTRVTKVTLRPKVVFDASVALEKTAALHEKAHANCFIANSVRFPMEIEHEHSHG